MKKFVLLMMSFLAVMAIIGCGGKTTTAAPTTGAPTTVAPTTVPPTTAAPTTAAPTTAAPTTVATDTDPVISGADDVTIEKNSVFVPLAGVTAFDQEDGDITDRITYAGNVNPMAVGVYTAVYTVVDNDGNVTSVERTVTVVFTDTQGPLLVGAGDITIYVGADFDPLEGVSANDTVDGNVPVTYTGEVNVWEVGTYTLSYSATDNSDNETTKDRVVTVTFGDFAFGDATDYDQAALTLADEVYTTPAFSGGVINDSIADFTYVRVEIDMAAATAGLVDVALGTLSGSATQIAVGTTQFTYVLYYLTDAPLVDAVFSLDSNGIALSNMTISISFAEVRDMVAPVLTVPSDEMAFVVNYSPIELEALLRTRVTAVDDIDGNLTSQVEIDYGSLDLATVGTYEVVYSVTDEGGNTTTFNRTLIIGNLVDSGFITDPTFQNNGDGQWIEKSNDGKASIAYDALTETMNITVTDQGQWLSAAGTYLKQPTSGLEVGQWYMMTFTVQTTIDRYMGFRMGLDTDQTNGWIDDFDGRSDIQVNLTGEYQTFNYFFKLDSLTSSAGYTDFKIELNLGSINYDSSKEGGITSFTNVYMYKVVTSFEAPTYELNHGANLPVKFTVGDTAPNWADYVTFMDMSKNILTPTIDATAVDMNAVGVYDIIFTATDSHDMTTIYTLTIEVFDVEQADTTGPVVTIKDGVPTTIDQFTNFGEIQIHQLVDAIDAEDGIITVLPDMVDDGGLNFNVAGVYTITFTVYDLSGNITVFEVDVTIVDKQAPNINANNVTINVGDAFDPLANVTVVDNVDGVIDNVNVIVTGLEAFMDGGVAINEGVFVITLEVADALGNIATKEVTVEVINIEWDESSRTPLGTPDSTSGTFTATYDEVEEATAITGMVYSEYPWERGRWTYNFDTTELEFGKTYKFEIVVKAAQATELNFRVGAALAVEPWIDNYTGGLRTISITDSYVTYEIVFTVDKEILSNSKFEFTFGNLASDETNTIYVKSFDLLKEVEPVYELVHELQTPDEISYSTGAVDFVEEAYRLSDLVKYTYDWDTGRIVYYLDDSLFVMGETYRIVFTVKATTATEIHLRIGSTLWEDPWIDNFTGGLKTVYIGDTYATYEMVFVADKAIPNGNAKFQFMYGYLDTDNGNTLWIKDFYLEHLVVPHEIDQVVIDEFLYENETALEAEWTERTNGVNYTPSDKISLDSESDAMIFTLPAVANNGWTLMRKYDSLASFGATDDYRTLAFYVTNNTNKTTAAIWLYWGSQMGYTVTLPAVGESGWVYLNVYTASGKLPSEITDFAFGFDNWSSSPYTGYVAIHHVTLVKDPVELDYIIAPIPPAPAPTGVVIEDFLYESEEDFELNWTERTNGANVNPSNVISIDLDSEAMLFEFPAVANDGWIIARKYSSLASLGGTDEHKYLAFYMENNTNVTSAVMWIYWAENQNSFPITLPAIGTSGWVILKLSVTGKTTSQITDFGIGFNNWSSSPVTGSFKVYEIVLEKDQLNLLDHEVTFPLLERLVDDFTYADEAAFEAEWTERTNGANIDPSTRINLDADLNAMVMTLPETPNEGYFLARKYDPLTAYGATNTTNYLAFYVTNNTTVTNATVWLYWSGSQNAFPITLPAIGETGWAYINVGVSGKDATLITDFAIGFNNWTATPVYGSLTVYQINLVEDAAQLAGLEVVIPAAPVNEAPVITISDANLAAISGITLLEGQPLDTMIAALLAMIEITDAEDGTITATQEMLSIGDLDLVNPVMGTYPIQVNAVDSEGKPAVTYTFNLQILQMVESFNSYTDDADFKANWPRINAFRVSGESWGLTAATLSVLVDNNVLEFTYGPSTNGIKFNVTKTELEALGAEYIGIYVKTSVPLTGSSMFQAFYYYNSGNSFTQMTTYGTVSYTDEGTYFFVKVADMAADTVAISLMINAAADNTGTMIMDNIVIK
jgi:hypothetical protein